LIALEKPRSWPGLCKAASCAAAPLRFTAMLPQWDGPAGIRYGIDNLDENCHCVFARDA
jgi:hypothetical protein